MPPCSCCAGAWSPCGSARSFSRPATQALGSTRLPVAPSRQAAAGNPLPGMNGGIYLVFRPVSSLHFSGASSAHLRCAPYPPRRRCSRSTELGFGNATVSCIGGCGAIGNVTNSWDGNERPGCQSMQRTGNLGSYCFDEAVLPIRKW